MLQACKQEPALLSLWVFPLPCAKCEVAICDIKSQPRVNVHVSNWCYGGEASTWSVSLQQLRHVVGV